ncbi:GTPase [Deltaproteobacteria bacterium TL4]
MKERLKKIKKEQLGKIKNLVKDHFLHPKVDNAKVEEHLSRIRKELPVPVIWLLGKTQSGKTSLIRALTNSTQSEIGDGIRPCTKTAVMYDFPNQEHGFVRFLDTRGLGEVDYDPKEDMNLFKTQSHLLIVVMKAMDHAQQSVMEPLKKIVEEHPEWPVIVAQTSLHEGYPDMATPHALPYAYRQSPFPDHLPSSLTLSLLRQRELFKDIRATFVPLDFTLPEDELDPPYYGLNELWEDIEQILPLGLRTMMKEKVQVRKNLKDIYIKTAHPHIIAYAIAAGGSGLIPVPFVAIPIISTVQFKMYQTLASIYNQEFNARRYAELASTLGVGFIASMGGRELLKVIPGFGAAVSSLYASATTYALGHTICAYFSYALKGDIPTRETFQKLYKEQFAEGRGLLQKYMASVKNASEPFH